MQVDPEILRAFASQVDVAAAAIAGAGVGNAASAVGDGLPGSTTQWACRLVGAHLTQTADEIATNVSDMGAAVRGARDLYEVTDDELAGKFDGLF